MIRANNERNSAVLLNNRTLEEMHKIYKVIHRFRFGRIFKFNNQRNKIYKCILLYRLSKLFLYIYHYIQQMSEIPTFIFQRV